TENVQEIVKDSGVRSVFIFDASKLTERFMVTLFKSFKLLRVLYFKNTLLDCLPKEVGNFFHLKYLCLTNTKVKILPKSIGKLQKLQTLDLVNTLVCELPCEINDLRRMRHILTSHNHRSFKTVPGMKLPKGIGCLEDLQTLCSVEAHEGPGAVSELEKLRQLRMLSISKLTTETGKALCAFIEKMNYLEDLALSSVSEDEILDLECISSPPYLLRFLSLRGPLQKLPCWISMLHNLLEIWLFHTKLLDDQLRILHSLPNLQKLYLYHAYDTEKFHFKEGGFQKLKFLNIRDHDGLKEVQIDRGALPCLQTLGMWAGLLREVPSGIQHLTSLKTLRFFDLPGEFVNSLEPCGGQDYWKVRHVTSVTFWKTIFGDPDVFLGKLRESDPINICCKHHLKPV
ncbi:LRR domain containing protein, partial [Trema orientale]